MKRHFLTACCVALLASASFSVRAETTVYVAVVNVYADPSDVVIEADTAGNCGSKFFHIQRSRANFKEMTAVALTAFTSMKHMNLFVESCVGDRNILSHGAVFGN